MKLVGKKIELVHSHHNGTQKCKHNARLNYAGALIDPIEDNGDSDLDNVDVNGNKIKCDKSNFKANHPKNPICTIQKTGKKVVIMIFGRMDLLKTTDFQMFFFFFLTPSF